MQRQNEIVAAANERRASWLASNELAQQNYAALDSIHKDAVNSGLIDTSPQYFDYLDDRLAALQDRQHRPERMVEEMQAMAAQDRSERPQPVPRPPVRVSAPPSRDTTFGSNSPSRIRLSREQCEMARAAGITESEYAAQLIRLREEQASGNYSERR
jgi:hypothetical protein